MLAGVGGRTVAEAKANLSYREAHDWFVFARQRGGLRHVERLLATICTQINRLTGGEADIGDFLPMLKAERSREDEPEATIAEVFQLLTLAAN